MRVLIGLGNPGAEYEQTRHNVGFWCVEAVAEQVGVKKWKNSKDGLLAEATLGKEKVLLFKPQKFMNLSGLPIRQLIEYYNLEPADLAIVADDVYVAPGSVRIRQSGGDGGHNGWKSVLEHLDFDKFWRIKIGAGVYEQHPEKRKHMTDLERYVLEKMPKHDEKLVRQLIDKITPNLIQWLEHRTGLEEATVHL